MYVRVPPCFGVSSPVLAATAGTAIAASQAASKADRIFAASLVAVPPILAVANFADRRHPSLHHRTSLHGAKWPDSSSGNQIDHPTAHA
jgi:hypothetical protein